MSTVITGENKYLNKDGLSKFFNILNGKWGDNKITSFENSFTSSIAESYLSLKGGTLTGGLTTQNINPSESLTYNLGSPSTQESEGVKWLGVYANTVEANIVSANKFNGDISGNADSASSTKGTLYFGNRNTDDSSTPKNITPVFDYNGKIPTYITAERGLTLVQDLNNTSIQDNVLYYGIGHSNSVTSGTVSGSSGQIEYGGQINIPSISFDSHGHITGVNDTKITLPQDTLNGKPGSYYEGLVTTLKNEIDGKLGEITDEDIEAIINESWV